MTHDVFISYSTKNTEHAEAIYERLESNGIKCWFAPENIGTAKNFAEEIMLGIKPCKVLVLVFSKDAQASEYVNNEIDAAFKENKHIVPIKIDDSFPKDQMAFYLTNFQWLDASPSALKKENKTLDSCYDQLVEDVREVIDELDPSIPDEEKRKKKDVVIQRHNQSFFEKHKIPIIALIVALIAIVGIVAYSTMGSDTSTNLENETGIDIGYVGLEDNGDGSYSYYVFGTVAEGFSNSSSDVIHIDFIDNTGEVADSSDTKIGEIDGNILGSTDTSKKNIDKVSLELQDKNDKSLYKVESNNIIEQ